MESKKPKRKRRTKAEMEAARKGKQKAKEIEQELNEAFDNHLLEALGEPEQKKGLGDAVEAVTKATGIKAFIEFMNGGKPCRGCEKRKAALNKLRFRTQPLALTEKDVQFIERIKDRKILRASETIELFQIHARVWRYRYQVPGNCASCVQTKYNDLIELYKAYEK